MLSTSYAYSNNLGPSITNSLFSSHQELVSKGATKLMVYTLKKSQMSMLKQILYAAVVESAGSILLRNPPRIIICA